MIANPLSETGAQVMAAETRTPEGDVVVSARSYRHLGCGSGYGESGESGSVFYDEELGVVGGGGGGTDDESSNRGPGLKGSPDGGFGGRGRVSHSHGKTSGLANSERLFTSSDTHFVL